MVWVHVSYTVKPGMRQAYLEAIEAAGYLTDIRGNPDCLAYDYYNAVHDEDVLFLVERWSSQAALDRHGAQPYAATQKALKEQYVLQTKVHKISGEEG